jgi:hypothetical protein
MDRPGTSQRFRGLRQLVGNLIVTVIGVFFLIFVAVSIVVSPPSTGKSHGYAAVAVCAVGVLALVALLVRMRQAFTVEIHGDILTYRSLLRTVRYKRSEVARIGLQERHRGLPKIMQPYLELTDGRTVWLADMGQGVLIAPNSAMQADLVAAVTRWIDRTSSPVESPRHQTQ